MLAVALLLAVWMLTIIGGAVMNWEVGTYMNTWNGRMRGEEEW